MVCEKCESKLQKIATSNPWKSGTKKSGTDSAGRKLKENKVLTAKHRFSPYSAASKVSGKFQCCKICGSSVHLAGGHYCQGCAYKKGICAMCGKKIIGTKNYRQTST